MHDQQTEPRPPHRVNHLGWRRSKTRAILIRLARTSTESTVWLPIAAGGDRIDTPLLDVPVTGFASRSVRLA